MTRSIFNNSVRHHLSFSICLVTALSMLGCTKERVEPHECGTEATEPAGTPGHLRSSPVSFMSWTVVGTQYTIWKNGVTVGKLLSGVNPLGIQMITDNATSLTVEGLTYQQCTTNVTAGTFTFQKGTTAGAWGPYYDITGAGLPRLRFRILNGSTPSGTDSGGYFNLNNGTSTWTTHSTTGTYFQWQTGVIFNNNCMPH